MGPFLRRRCPVCGRAVEPHCASTTCAWKRCPAPACRASINFRLGRGIQYLPDGVARVFRFTTPDPPGGLTG
jgi:hypothetical protein